MSMETFDSTTRHRMELALDQVCSELPDAEHHEVRAPIARAILRSAQRGKNTIDAMVEAARAAIRIKSQAVGNRTASRR
jgi:hypothetical protein